MGGQKRPQRFHLNVVSVSDSNMNATPTTGQAQEQLGAFQFVILILSVVTVGAITADAFFNLPHEISRIVQWVDLVACVLFFIDFVVRFRAAPSKLDFMKLGWIDLLASIPNVAWLRYGRLVRVLRVLRLLRGIRSLHRLYEVAFADGRRGGVASVASTAFLLVVFSSVAVLMVETDGNSNIKTAGDAIWWSVTTVTTVGYGDRYPVTTEGRMLGMGLMVCGVGLFSVMSGLVASMFLGSRHEDPKLIDELRALRMEMERSRQR